MWMGVQRSGFFLLSLSLSPSFRICMDESAHAHIPGLYSVHSTRYPGELVRHRLRLLLLRCGRRRWIHAVTETNDAYLPAPNGRSISPPRGKGDNQRMAHPTKSVEETGLVVAKLRSWGSYP
ncbi:hypothetical protein LZ30DRAFT_743229 [Colletotrichum cereale]|nr:hypothetical protein LZ30DRAFT_743229 [Colletotrichum cereale]